MILLASCGGGDEFDEYGPEHRAAFVEDCTTDDVGTRTCRCFYDRLTLEVPFDRFVELDAALSQPQTATDLPDDIALMAAACAAENQRTDGG
jgi:hypothetical protein